MLPPRSHLQYQNLLSWVASCAKHPAGFKKKAWTELQQFDQQREINGILPWKTKYSKQKTIPWEKNQYLGPCTHYYRQDTVSRYNMDRVNQNQVDVSDLWVHDFDTSTCCLGRDSRQAYRPWRLVINISRPSSQEILQLPWLPHHGWFDIACPFQHGSSIIANMWSSTCDSSPLAPQTCVGKPDQCASSSARTRSHRTRLVLRSPGQGVDSLLMCALGSSWRRAHALLICKNSQYTSRFRDPLYHQLHTSNLSIHPSIHLYTWNYKHSWKVLRIPHKLLSSLVENQTSLA